MLTCLPYWLTFSTSPSAEFLSDELLREVPVNRQEFENLRDLRGKRIVGDIVWDSPRDGKPNLVFDQIPVENSAGWDVILNGTYKPGIPALTFNFVLRGSGPICRIDVNGTIHGAAGRTHKHDLRRDDDPRKNLLTAVPGPDLDNKSVVEVWNSLCVAANIEHVGTLRDPEQP